LITEHVEDVKEQMVLQLMEVHHLWDMMAPPSTALHHASAAASSSLQK
jgi:hypothetical protein